MVMQDVVLQVISLSTITVMTTGANLRTAVYGYHIWRLEGLHMPSDQGLLRKDSSIMAQCSSQVS